MKSENPKCKAVFIDRDGTLIEEVNFLSRVEDLRFFSFTKTAINLLKENGFLVIVVTNQSGIGRGIFEERAMHEIHAEIQRRLDDKIEAFYFCPHLPDANCSCRKPQIQMIEQATRDFSIDLSNSWMIGDKPIDIEAGFNAKTKTALVLTGYGRNSVESMERKPDIIAENIFEAIKQIISYTEKRTIKPKT